MGITRFGSVWKASVSASAAVLAIGLVVHPSAAATPPENDVWSGAMTLSLGDVVRLDTSAATTGPMDARLNRACGAPFTNASVWYKFTPDRDLGFRLDMSDSDYEGGFMVFQGDPSTSSMVDCGPDRLTVRATANVTYAIVAFSDNRRNGGLLVLSITERPLPTVAVEVADHATLTGAGDATVVGSFRCLNAPSVSLRAELVQRLGREKIVGVERLRVWRQCDDAWHPVNLEFSSSTHRFSGGWAVLNLTAVSCNSIGCARTAIADREIKLRRG